jgi:hypothetical protein
MVERKIFVEGAFGLAKELHGLRRTRFRGRQRVQVQLWLTAAAMNIKKAVQAGTRTGSSSYILRFFRRLRAVSTTSSRWSDSSPTTTCFAASPSVWISPLIRRLCRPFYSHTGQPSADPVVLFRLLPVGYLYGNTSERRVGRGGAAQPRS